MLQMHFEIAYFPLCSYSSGIERINTFIDSRSSLENHTRFQTKMSKVFTRFQTKHPYPIGRHVTYMAYIGEYPPRTGVCSHMDATPTPGDQNRERFDNFFTVFKPAVEWPKSELLT